MSGSSGPEKAAGGEEGSALHMPPGTGGFMNPAVVLPLQPDEVIREPLDRLARLGGELVGREIIDRSSRGLDLVNATQEETSLSQERLGFLGRFGRGGRPLVSGMVVCHRDSVRLSRRRGEWITRNRGCVASDPLRPRLARLPRGQRRIEVAPERLTGLTRSAGSWRPWACITRGAVSEG